MGDEDARGGAAFLAGGGEMGALIRAHDWAATPLGHPDAWPLPLRTLLGVMLGSRQPMFLAWGAERTMLYNDGYAPLCGVKHPWALGRPFAEVWSDILGDVGPIMDRGFAGEPTSMDDIRLTMLDRRGLPEEAHFSFSYTPVRDARGWVAGVLCACHETTHKVLADRRRELLLELGDLVHGLAEPKAITAAAAGLLGRRLGASQVGYSLLDAEGYVTTDAEHSDGRMPSLAGRRYRPDDFGPEMVAELRAGRTVAIAAVERDGRTSSPAVAAAFARLAVRAFVAVPLVKEGRWLAFLYVAHPEPRWWSEEEVGLAREVAERTWAAIERARAEAALRASEERWRGVFEHLHEGFMVCEMVHDDGGEAVDFRHLEVNAAVERLSGIPPGAIVGRLASEAIPGIERFWTEVYARVVATGEPAHFEYRLAALDRWFEVRAYRTEPGRFAALFLNVTERKAAEERQALLAREVDHRAKNALALVQATLRLTPAPDIAAYRRAIDGRVAALARAQALLSEDRWAGADLRAMLRGELEPFLAGEGAGAADQGGRAAPWVELDGPAVVVPADVAQPLAMAVHELATNAVKHGALSAPAGRVAIAWRLDDGPTGALRLRWAEAGGPTLAGPPERLGFGSRVLDGTVRGQLGGAVTLAWEAGGLICGMEVPLGVAKGGTAR